MLEHSGKLFHGDFVSHQDLGITLVLAGGGYTMNRDEERHKVTLDSPWKDPGHQGPEEYTFST